MRALQNEPSTRISDITETVAFERLREITSSCLYENKTSDEGLLLKGLDPLAIALLETMTNWTIEHLTSRAYEIARSGDDYSLVGLAALARDPLVMTTLRESTVLYAVAVAVGLPPKKSEYSWKVDSAIAARAAKFVATFNSFFSEDIPEPIEENAKCFFDAADLWGIEGRCVRIGLDDSKYPVRHYHWAINAQYGGLFVDDFWDNELWTTQRYIREKQNQLLQNT